MAALGAGLASEKAAYFPHAGFVYSANKKSLVSGMAWVELSTAASAVMIKKVNEYSKKPQARQILFSILGEPFVEKYFDIKSDYKPYLLEMPYMMPNVRASLQEEFTVILANAISAALADPDHAINNCAALEVYQAAVDGAYGSVMAEEGRIMMQTGPTKEQLAKRRRNHKSRRNNHRLENDVGGGTGRSGSELLGIAITTLLLGNGWTLDENETHAKHYAISIKNKDEDNMVHGSAAMKLTFAATRKIVKGSDIGGENPEDADGVAGEKRNPQGDDGSGNGNGSSKALDMAKKDASEMLDSITGLSLDDPRLLPAGAHQSDLLSYIDGSGLVTSKGAWGIMFRGENRAVLRTVIGRCVPVSIRRFILKCRLFNSEHATLSASVIRRNMAINRISDSTKSTIDNLISRAATQTFLDLLRDFDSPRLRRQTICLLNQYYTYSGSQHPSHTCLTVPLVLSFSNQPVDGPFLVSMFDRMLRVLPGGGPSRKDTLTVSRKLVDLLAESDGDLFLHLTGLVDRARHYQQTLPDGGAAAEFTELATFFEPWVSTCLVGILRRDAVLFVWDQCFLTGWQHQFPKFCVDILKVISVKLMEVRSAPELKRTLMTLPRRVHTRNMRTQYAQRTKRYPKERNLDEFWKEPALGKLSRESPREDDLVRIEKLLATTAGSDELRRHADLEARKNEIETQRDIKAMAHACEYGLFEKARKLLEGDNIEASDTTTEGETFLSIAAGNSQLKCVQLLLDAGADPNLGVISTGLTPLMGCVIGANTIKVDKVKNNPDETQACIVALVRAGANVNQQSTRTVLRPREMISADQKEKELVRMRGGNPIGASVDEETDSKKEDKSEITLTLVPRGSTALHMAVACTTLQGTRYFAHPLLVMTLVYCGADAKLINIQETTAPQILQDARHMPKDRKTAIQSALKMALPGKVGIDDKILRLADQLRAGVRMGQISQVRRVTKTVKSMDKQIKRFILNSPGSMGLHAKMLRDAGALVEITDQAATSGSESKKDAWDRDQSKKLGSVQSIDRDYPNLFERRDWEKDAASMLSIAAHQAHKDICVELVRLGASINEGWPGPVSPLMCAVIGYGEDTDGPDSNRSHAGTGKSVEVAQWLYENGALANVRSTDTGRTALHWAGMMGREGLFEVLKTAGLLDDSQPDWKGVVPSSALAQALKKGAPVLVPNVDGAPLVPKGGHLDDFVEDVADEDEIDQEKDLLYVVIKDIVETKTMGALRIPLVEWIEGVDELVGTRNLIMGVRDNAKKLSRVVKAIIATRNVDAKKAKRVCTESLDAALMKKMPKLRDDRKLPILKARVKNNAGDNVVVKIRALIPGDSPDLANKLAKVTCERNGLPEKSIPKLVKALLAYSAKKTNYSAKAKEAGDTRKVSEEKSHSHGSSTAEDNSNDHEADAKPPDLPSAAEPKTSREATATETGSDKSLTTGTNADVVAPPTIEEAESLAPPPSEPKEVGDEEKAKGEEEEKEKEEEEEDKSTDDDFHELVAKYSREDRQALIKKMGRDLWKSLSFEERYTALVKEYGKLSE